MNKIVTTLLLYTFYVLETNAVETEERNLIEARGKAKYALLMHFFYVAATKIFVLKIVYGIIFYIIVVKAWHLVLWLIHYVKEKKHDHYVEVDHDVYDHHPYHHHDHEPVYGHHPYHDDHGPSYGNHPYSAYDKPEFDSDYLPSKKIYDADGSYSVG